MVLPRLMVKERGEIRKTAMQIYNTERMERRCKKEEGVTGAGDMQ